MNRWGQIAALVAAVMTTGTPVWAAANRTIDAQFINNAGSTVTVPAATTTLVGTGTTDTLTNKSISGATNTFSAIPTGAIAGSALSGSNSGDVTIGTANGLSLVGQALSLGLSSTSTTGALSSTDWNVFNGKFSNPMTTLGDVIYGGSAGAGTRLAGNITTTKMFLSQTGNGSVSAAPAWASLAAADLAVAVTPGTSGNVLTSNGTTWTSAAPSAAAPTLSGSTGTPTLITAAGGITFAGVNYQNIYFIAGDSGPITITATPKISAGTSVGQRLELIGTNDTDTVTITDGNGVNLNGTVVLANHSAIGLVWDGTVWVEEHRR